VSITGLSEGGEGEAGRDIDQGCGAVSGGRGSTVHDVATALALEVSGSPHPACPKHMVYGPCGGVRADGACELGDRPCPFVGAPLVRWTGPAAPAGTFPFAPADGSFLIITDLRVRPFDAASIAEVTAHLAPDSDALLVGEHHSRPDFPPSFVAATIIAAGGRPLITLTCRDRNRVVLESELEALTTLDVAGVHCVTGDARAVSVRADASQVFDVDSLRLSALARRAGLAVSVAATPIAPPVDLRPRRLVEKEAAGAQLCIVNHAGGPEGVACFVAAAQAAGVTMPFVACVAVFTDAASFAVLEAFPGLLLDPDAGRRVLGSPDPRAAGIDAAVEQALAMLAIDGVAGVNLSGSATSGPETESARIMAQVAAGVRAAAR